MVLESAAMQRWRKGDPWGFVERYAPQVTYFDTGTARRINSKQALARSLRTGKGRSSTM